MSFFFYLNFVYCPSITHKDDHTAIKKSYKETPSFGHFYTLLLISNIISMQYSFSDRGFQKEHLYVLLTDNKQNLVI
jgi:hypothetical protein